MRNKIAKTMIITGVVSVLAALSLFIYNRIASSNAAKFAEDAVSQLQSPAVREHVLTPGNDDDPDHPSENGSTDNAGMEYVIVNEYEFIGYLSIPSLRLNLPVISEWSYDNLNLSPCRYSGSPATDDFVIAAHNYSSHFGFISSLNIGDTVSFTDVRHKQIDYRVELIDTLSPTDVKDMTASEYDLTLFTCTYSGEARVTVRCNRLSD